MKNKILIVTDNFIMYQKVYDILFSRFENALNLFDFKRSKLSKIHKLYANGIEILDEIDIKNSIPLLSNTYDLILSIHCKQIFPSELIDLVPCINLHPGYNPYNRGWYPQVFAIIEKQVLGATLHIMDKEIDHGKIIDRKKVKIESSDTSKEAYEKVLEAELELFDKNIESIVSETYSLLLPEEEGTYHSIDDFRKICHLDLGEKLTLGEAIDKLRALSHGSYKNAFFIDGDGNKIFVSIDLTKSCN